jgi:arylsulfatase A-like enzyme
MLPRALRDDTVPDERRNILFILTDQMRGDCLSITGHPVVETPHIDDLGRRGTVFTSAYSTCPSCIAARCSMFTGLTPSTHGRLGYRDQVPWRYDDTLPELLGRVGYQTHCVGKTHFFPQRAHLGFDSMDSYEANQNFDGTYVNDYFEWLREKTGGLMSENDHGLNGNGWDARPSHLPEELHNNTWVAARGIEFLRRRDKTRPFFLFLSFHRPHAPLDPARPFWDMYAGREIPPVPVGDWAGRHDVPVERVDAWQGRLAEHLLVRARRAYYAQIAHIDSQVGRIMKVLGVMGVGPTDVIFTSDHGEMLGDHHLFRKTYAYAGSAKVPFIVCPHGGAPAKLSDAPVAIEDVYPTILELAGVPVPERTEGLSVLPLCEGRAGAPWRPFVHGEHAGNYADDEAMQYLTGGKEKYIWFTLSGREQLFDLEGDPDELHDLAGDPAAQDSLKLWHSRMVEVLAARPEDGLSDGQRLVAGKLLPAVRPQLLA